MKLDLIDELLLLGQGRVRSLDCSMVVQFTNMPSREELHQGILRAQSSFPKSGKFSVRILENISLLEFLNTPLPSPAHLELLLLPEKRLAMKMSHLMGDGVSMLLWMKVLLEEDFVPVESLNLRKFPPKKDTPYRKIRTSSVWPGQRAISNKRGVLMRTLSHKELAPQKNLNDIFVLSLLESLPEKRKSVWLPVNARLRFWEGFGNGLSRLRIYPSPESTVEAQLTHISRQKKMALTNGEISLPPECLKLDTALKKNLFLGWLNRPWADWSSIGLSHIQENRPILSKAESLWGIPNIMPRHQAGFFIYSSREESWVSLIYDSGSVTEAEATGLFDHFQYHFKRILHETNS